MKNVALLLVAASLLAVVAASRPTESTLRLANNSVAAITVKDVSASYRSLAPLLRAAERSRAALCKKAKCTVLNGTKSWGQKTYVEVKPYQALTITKSLRKAYTGAIAILGKFSAFAMSSSSWTLTGSKIEATNKNTWFTLTNSALGLVGSQILGTFRSFTLTKSQLAFDKSQVDLVNTVVAVKPGSKLTIKDTGFNVNGTSTAAYPFVVDRSAVDITRGVILFKNVKDAYFVNSTVSLLDVQLVLINSRVTFIGGAFNSTNSVARLSNSTITFSKAAFTGDRYLSATSGFPRLPKTLPKPYKLVGTTEFAVSGNGNVTLRSATS